MLRYRNYRVQFRIYGHSLRLLISDPTIKVTPHHSLHSYTLACLSHRKSLLGTAPRRISHLIQLLGYFLFQPQRAYLELCLFIGFCIPRKLFACGFITVDIYNLYTYSYRYIYMPMASNRSGRSGADRDVDTERTPLLGNGVTSEHIANGGDATQNDQQQDGETVVVAEQVSTTKLVLIMGTTFIGVVLGAIDSTIIATLSAPIASDFQSLSLLSWLATAYLIANAACQPISGRLTDIFGRGPGLVFSNVFFALGNLICGVAQSSGVMIFGRVVAGIGGGGMMSISTFIGSDLIPLRQRGIVQGVGNICYGSGAMLGGIFGGLINDHTKMGWRLAFLVQVPPALISAVAVAVLVKIPPKQSDKSYLSRIDFGGVFFTISFLVLLLLGLNSGGNLVPWIHPLPLTTIPLSFVAFAGFIWWESKAVQPIIPVKLLADRTVLSACLCNLLATMVVITAVFYIPLYLQVLGDSATMAGLKILPSPIGISIASLGSGYIMKRTGRYVKLGITSLVLLILGIVLFTLQGDENPVWLTSVAFFLVGAGYGAMLTITLLACIAAVDHSQQAVVTSATCEYLTFYNMFPLSSLLVIAQWQSCW